MIPYNSCMKLILDFDDVIFDNTRRFKPHMYHLLVLAGIPKAKSVRHNKLVREHQFSLKNFIADLLGSDRKKNSQLYKKAIEKCPEYVNQRLVKLVKRVGKKNCYLVTSGDWEFQHEKIRSAGVSQLFNQVLIAPESKRDLVHSICEKYSGERVLFVDDKARFFSGLNFRKFPNLKTLLFDKNGYRNVLRWVSGELRGKSQSAL